MQLSYGQVERIRRAMCGMPRDCSCGGTCNLTVDGATREALYEAIADAEAAREAQR